MPAPSSSPPMVPGRAGRLAVATDPVSTRLLRAQIAAESAARAQAARGQLTLASASRGPFVSARALAAEVQAREHTRQSQARHDARTRSRRAILLVAIAGALALIG